MPSLAVGTAPVDVIGPNTGRLAITLTNRSTAGQVISIDNVASEGLTAANAGFVLAPGAAVGLVLVEDGEEIRQPWSAIADGAGGLLYWKETAVKR